MDDYPRYLYHPTEAPTGFLFETAEKTARLGPGWVNSPAEFPKPKVPGAPIVSGSKAIALINAQIDKAGQFLSSPDLATVAVYDAWTNTTIQLLEMVFGRPTANVKKFEQAHSLPMMIRGATGWDKHIRHKAKNQVAILGSCIEQLEIEQSIDGPAADLDQKFGILFSPKAIEGHYREAISEGHPACILFVDIDHFKSINATFKESIVDRDLLPNVHRGLRHIVHTRGFAYKQGGDEFILLLPNHTREDGLIFAERVRRWFSTATFAAESKSVALSVSIGLATFPDHGSDLESVQAAANAAEHEAKKTRNCVRVAP